MLRLLLFLALLGTVAPAGAQAQSPVPASATPADEALKGSIWTKTAQRIWNTNDGRAPTQRPAPWGTVGEFKDWCKSKEAQTDKSGLMGLKNQVFDRFGGEAASPRQLIDTIIANVTRAKELKTELRAVDAGALARELNAIPGLPVRLLSAPQPSSTTATAPPIPATTPTPPAAADSQPGVVARPAPPAVMPPTVPTSFVAQHPALSLGLAFLLGTVLGALLMAIRQSQQRSSHSTDAAHEPKTQLGKVPGSHDAFNQMKKEAEDMREVSAEKARRPTEQTPRKRSSMNPTPEKSPPPLPAPAEASAPAPPAVPVAAPPVARYAPAQEGGHIEERKLVAEALPQLPIMLTIDARNPDRATFTLNPHVNQGKLIGDGLEQLRDYFEYELPGRISSVTAAAPGQLVRQGDGWQVSTLARLEVR